MAAVRNFVTADGSMPASCKSASVKPKVSGGVEGRAHALLDLGVDEHGRGGGLHLAEHDADALLARRVDDHLDPAAAVGEQGRA